MYYPDEIKIKAFEYFCLGWSLSQIARKIGVDWKTVRTWRRKYDWDRKKERIDQRIGEELENKSVDWKVQIINELMEIKDELVRRYKQARTGNVEQLTKALDVVIEKIALLKGEAIERSEHRVKVLFEDV